MPMTTLLRKLARRRKAAKAAVITRKAVKTGLITGGIAAAAVVLRGLRKPRRRH